MQLRKNSVVWACWGVYLSGVSSFGWFTFFMILVYIYAYKSKVCLIMVCIMEVIIVSIQNRFMSGNWVG